jgi:hypothetical protein
MGGPSGFGSIQSIGRHQTARPICSLGCLFEVFRQKEDLLKGLAVAPTLFQRISSRIGGLVGAIAPDLGVSRP